MQNGEGLNKVCVLMFYKLPRALSNSKPFALQLFSRWEGNLINNEKMEGALIYLPKYNHENICCLQLFVSPQLLAFCPIINSLSWYWERFPSTLGGIGKEVIGGIIVGGEEEVACYQLKVILLCNSNMVINPASISKSFIAANLSLIHHVYL